MFSLVAATLNLMMALPPEKRACVTKWISLAKCFKMGALVEIRVWLSSYCGYSSLKYVLKTC